MLYELDTKGTIYRDKSSDNYDVTLFPTMKPLDK